MFFPTCGSKMVPTRPVLSTLNLGFGFKLGMGKERTFHGKSTKEMISWVYPLGGPSQDL